MVQRKISRESLKLLQFPESQFSKREKSKKIYNGKVQHIRSFCWIHRLQHSRKIILLTKQIVADL